MHGMYLHHPNIIGCLYKASLEDETCVCAGMREDVNDERRGGRTCSGAIVIGSATDAIAAKPMAAFRSPSVKVRPSRPSSTLHVAARRACREAAAAERWRPICAPDRKLEQSVNGAGALHRPVIGAVNAMVLFYDLGLLCAPETGPWMQIRMAS